MKAVLRNIVAYTEYNLDFPYDPIATQPTDATKESSGSVVPGL